MGGLQSRQTAILIIKPATLSVYYEIFRTSFRFVASWNYKKKNFFLCCSGCCQMLERMAAWALSCIQGRWKLDFSKCQPGKLHLWTVRPALRSRVCGGDMGERPRVDWSILMWCHSSVATPCRHRQWMAKHNLLDCKHTVCLALFLNYYGNFIIQNI